MSYADDDVDGFIGHRATGGRGNFLSGKWKDKGELEVWLHTALAPKPLWRHRFQRIHIWEDRGGGGGRGRGPVAKKVWGDNFNCLEPEVVLQKQNKRDDDDDRETPPEYCPYCKLVEVVRRLMREGKIRDLDPIFTFQGEGNEKEEENKLVVVYAGGLVDLWQSNVTLVGEGAAQQVVAQGPLSFTGSRKLEKGTGPFRRLKEARVRIQDLWMQSGKATLQYVCAIVENKRPEKGVQIAIETSLLGDKMKDMIAATRKSLKNPEHSPFRHPYCVRWEYFKDENEPNKKYSATRIETEQLTERVKALITGPKPDISQVMALGNPKTLLAQMKAHGTEELARALKHVGGLDAVFDVPARPQSQQPSSGPSAAPSAPVAASAPPAPPRFPCEGPDDPQGNAMGCGSMLKGRWVKFDKPYMLAPDDEVCPKCGAEYEVEKPAAKGAAPAAAAASPAPARAPAAAAGGGSDDEDDAGGSVNFDDDDDIPFVSRRGAGPFGV